MNKIRLGVNIDHVATIRNARGENYPEPVRAALLAEESGADSITIHIREDRRHIREEDLKKIKRKIKIPLNLEIAPTSEMIKIALKHKPNFICIVPEKRQEITTEGGLNLKKKRNLLKKIIKIFKKNSIRTSLFIEANPLDIKIASDLKADCVEFHTGRFCKLFKKKKSKRSAYNYLKRNILYAHKLGLEVHAGHGLTYSSAKIISKIKHLTELNIGHFIVSESIFLGLKRTISKFKKIIRNL